MIQIEQNPKFELRISDLLIIFAQNILHKNAHTDHIRAFTHELSKSEKLETRAKNTYATNAKA